MEKTSKKAFIKYNNRIVPKPEGMDYYLTSGKVYDLRYSSGIGTYLEEGKDFEFPKNYILSEEDNRFVNKTISAFNNTTKMTTGVMLSGTKGSGKTLMAKHIAMQTGLPVIVIDPAVHSSDCEEFFSKTDTPCCMIFDEIDKYWNVSRLLTFLDGVRPTCKELVVCTCNKEKDIDEYLNDRCSRIRYKKIFTSLDKTAAKAVISDIVGDEQKAEEATNYLFDNAKLISYDNTMIFAEEIRNNPTESLDTIFSDLNMTSTKEEQEKNVYEKLKEKVTESLANMDPFSNDDCCECCCAG